MIQVSVSLPEEVKEKIDKIAQEEKRSSSWILREIILEGLKNRKE